MAAFLHGSCREEHSVPYASSRRECELKSPSTTVNDRLSQGNDSIPRADLLPWKALRPPTLANRESRAGIARMVALSFLHGFQHPPDSCSARVDGEKFEQHPLEGVADAGNEQCGQTHRCRVFGPLVNAFDATFGAGAADSHHGPLLPEPTEVGGHVPGRDVNPTVVFDEQYWTSKYLGSRDRTWMSSFCGYGYFQDHRSVRRDDAARAALGGAVGPVLRAQHR